MLIHENRTEGCTTSAIDEVARKRYLDIVAIFGKKKNAGGSQINEERNFREIGWPGRYFQGTEPQASLIAFARFEITKKRTRIYQLKALNR